jgi:hypothetical protein
VHDRWLKFPALTDFLIRLCPMSRYDQSVRINTYRRAGIEGKDVFPRIYTKIWNIIIVGVCMLCLAVIWENDRDIRIGQNAVSEGAGEHMNKYLVTRINPSEVCEKP